MTETTFNQAVELVGRLPNGQERNDLIVHGKLWPELWKWSPYAQITLEQALETHEKHGSGYLIVRRPVGKAIRKQTHLPEQKSIGRKPLDAPAPALTTIVETIPSSQPQGPKEPPSGEEPAYADSSPEPIPNAYENPTSDLPTPTSESMLVETPVAKATASSESSTVPSMVPPHNQEVPNPITAPSDAPPEPILDSEATSSRPVNGMPPSASGDNGELMPVAAVDAITAASHTAQRPEPGNFIRSMNRLYLLVVWFVASSGVFAYLLGRFTALGVAWVVGYWMVTIAVGILLWAVSTLVSSSR